MTAIQIASTTRAVTSGPYERANACGAELPVAFAAAISRRAVPTTFRDVVRPARTCEIIVRLTAASSASR